MTAPREVYCLLLSPDHTPISRPLPVEVASNLTVAKLKKNVKEEKPNGLQGVDHDELAVWKCKEATSFELTDSQTIANQVRHVFSKNEVEMLPENKEVSKINFGENELLFVMLSDNGERATKKRKVENFGTSTSSFILLFFIHHRRSSTLTRIIFNDPFSALISYIFRCSCGFSDTIATTFCQCYTSPSRKRIEFPTHLCLQFYSPILSILFHYTCVCALSTCFSYAYHLSTSTSSTTPRISSGIRFRLPFRLPFGRATSSDRYNVLFDSSSFSAEEKATADMTLRQETVDSLYCRLNDLKFLQVRGTPVSGKSTLASLLFYYIYNIEGESPYWISSWPDPHSPGTPPGSRKPRLSEDAEGWAWEDNSVVIFDEAQSTYWDTSLWDDVFKTLCSNPTTRRNRVIIFSSYGSPTGAMAGGTPWDVPSKNRVSFCEDRPPDGYKPVGLFFTKDEFQNYVLRRNMLQQHKFSNQLPERIFILTAGHVGAMEELFRALTAQSCYRHLTRAQTYDIADFESLDPKDLLRGLEEGSIFSRGLPKTGHLRVPETAQIFKHVLCEGGITAPTPTTPTRLPEGALGNCFQRGWLHAIPAEDNQTSYVFATHLHKWFVQWKMFGEVPGAGLSYTDLLEFTFDAFSNFSPTLLSEERNIDLGITQSTPEAQFQSEFYRCSFQLSDGHVVTFPEFGTAKGRADFYIPSEEWGIELLRDGQKLEEHVGRFSKTGKYGKTLRLSQHIILDCRFTMPRKTNSHLQNLYHVVFTLSTKPDLNPVWTIEILDNNLNAVHGMKQVLTSSNDPF